MLTDRMKFLIDSKLKDISKKPLEECRYISSSIKDLNSFIDGSLELSKLHIENMLINFIQYGIYLDIPLEKGTMILRAVRYTGENIKKPYYEKVSRLSYIPQSSTTIPQIGRMNKNKVSMYYGCLSNGIKSVNVAFSEIDSLPYEYINILKSTLNKEIKVRYIGLLDYYRRGTEPPFNVHPLFKDLWGYYKETYDEMSLTVVGLVDAFFSDILKRKNYGRLYIVTSILASIIMEDKTTDGLIYPSIKAEGSPNVVLKPLSVDTKINHEKCLCFQINENFGYAIYNTTILFNGNIIKDKIKWRDS